MTTFILKVYVYESTSPDRLITYFPYSNKFEKPLPNGQRFIFCSLNYEIINRTYFFNLFCLKYLDQVNRLQTPYNKANVQESKRDK